MDCHVPDKMFDKMSDMQDAFEDDSHFQEIHSPFMTCNAVSSTAGGPSIIAVNKVGLITLMLSQSAHHECDAKVPICDNTILIHFKETG